MIRDAHESGTLADRLPPQNIEAEVQVLGAALIDRDALHEVMPSLAADDFYRDAHQTVYRAMCEMAASGVVVDAVTLAEELDRRKELRGVGGYEFVGELANAAPHSANALYHADIVRQKADTRRVIGRANEVLRRAYSNEFTSEQLVASAQADFLSIGDRAQDSSEVTLAHAVGRAMGTMDRRWQGEDPGVRLPFPDLDEMLDGFRPGRFYVIAARPGAGKSCMLFNIGDHAAMTGYGGGVPVLFFSLEMDAEELAERYLSAHAHVNGYGLKRPNALPKEKLDAIYAAARKADGSRLRIDDGANLTVPQIAARARRCKQRHGLGLVLVDYLQLVDGGKAKGENRQEEVARVSRGLKNLAKELKVPVVAACQLNRASETRPVADQVPRLSDLRESGQIEADAHAVILLHQPPDRPGTVDAIVPKNRGGSSGTVSLLFVKEETRFESSKPAPY